MTFNHNLATYATKSELHLPLAKAKKSPRVRKGGGLLPMYFFQIEMRKRHQNVKNGRPLPTNSLGHILSFLTPPPHQPSQPTKEDQAPWMGTEGMYRSRFHHNSTDFFLSLHTFAREREVSSFVREFDNWWGFFIII